MNATELKYAVESILFASDEPMSEASILSVISEVDVEVKQISAVITELIGEYQQSGRTFTIRKQGKGWQMTTTDHVNPWMRKLYQNTQRQRLSNRALETLAIIAYNEPVTRGEVDDIRGVNSDGIIRSLLEKDLITVVGRQKSPGNPMLYGTTKRFLLHFGLNSVKDLPTLKEIDELIKQDQDLEIEVKTMDPSKLGMTFKNLSKGVENDSGLIDSETEPSDVDHE